MKKILLITFFGFLMCSFVTGEEDIFTQERDLMVENQIISRGIMDENVISAMRKVKRHLFVPSLLRNSAYQDSPLPIGYGQTISQPYIVAYMTEVLNLKRDDKVLEVGTGSGYQAAVLSEIVDEVYTIEIVKPLADTARERLEEVGYKNIHVKHGDGYLGWPEFMPFDAIIITAAPSDIPEKLVEQLIIGGRMVVPVGSYYQQLYLITKTKNGVDKKILIPVKFVPMVKGKEAKMKIMSPAFEHHKSIPKKFTCQGEDVNPTLVIENIPEGTKSLTLIMDDPDAPMGTWVHWVVFDIPITSKIEENSIPGKQGINDFGRKNWGGPCPPSGTHRYFFKIYALDKELGLKEGVSKKDLEKAMEGHVLDKAELVGLYKKY